MQTLERRVTELEAQQMRHEAVCAERYKNIADNLETQTEKIDALTGQMDSYLKRMFSVVLFMALAVFGREWVLSIWERVHP